MQTKQMTKTGIAVAAVMMGLLAAQAGALPIDFVADTTGALPGLDFMGTLDYDNVSHTLVLEVINMSDPVLAGDPRLTGLAFLNPDSSVLTGINTFVPEIFDGLDFVNLSGWSESYNTRGILAPGHGNFDIAAITGPNFAGGDPNDGLAIGDWARFSFTFDTVGVDTLTSQSFVDILASSVLVARFQSVGIGGNGSDVVPATFRSGGGGNGVIPEPATVTLLGLGLAAFVVRRRMAHRA